MLLLTCAIVNSAFDVAVPLLATSWTRGVK